jgi:hypothetical protein
VLFLHAAAPLVRAQSVDEILLKTAQRYEDAMVEIDDMKMVLHPEGDFAAFDLMTTYYKKTEENGKPIFRTHTEFEGGFGDMTGPASTSRPLDLFSMGAQLHEKLVDVARYEGTEMHEGSETHVLFVEDFTPLMESLSDEPRAAGEALAFSEARIFIDSKEFVMRKITMKMDIREPEMTRTMQMEMKMGDYREVGPLYYPFRIKTILENPISAEQRSEMEAQRAEIEATLAQLPEAQREQMRKMLGALGNDQIVIELVMEDLRVNEGVPAALFED